MKRSVAHDMSSVGRLTLALGLALGLHAALLFGVAVDWRSFHPPAPRQLEVALLPTMVSPSPVEPVAAALEPVQSMTAPEILEAVVAPADPPLAARAPPGSLPVVPAPIPTPPPVAKPAATPVLKPSPKITTAPKTAPKITIAPKAIKSSPPSRPLVKPADGSVPAKTDSSAKAATPARPAPVARSVLAAVSPARMDSVALLGQIARLDAETSRRVNTGIRSKWVSSNDTQSPEGFYIAAWLRKVERIGENNFPEVARRLNLSVGPVLEVAIGADGALREVRIARSSGNAELDRAAQKIVRLGDPYAPFPPELRQKWDVLHISRPWRFEASGQLQVR